MRKSNLFFLLVERDRIRQMQLGSGQGDVPVASISPEPAASTSKETNEVCQPNEETIRTAEELLNTFGVDELTLELTPKSVEDVRTIGI